MFRSRDLKQKHVRDVCALIILRGVNPYGVVANMLGCDIEVSEFKPQSR